MIKMYTTNWCPDCHAAKRALTSKGIPFEEVNIEQDEQAAEYVMSVNGGKRSVPTLVSGDVARSLSGFRPQKLDAFLAEAGL
ncbi:glutaredoxin family protein [Deinococcus metallilatus]|uniref:Glutaredoxin family protein n=1 Tax=Deinococcus metallilatus TaxID=1211322 RepID=A0AAJ5F1K5_9DEIO|nr:glutaredoxin family protein [Deinococcus metallilatus]MBB5296660.1 mycoredoxin [Deinococcus metallilatus]QBY09253.1 glutaredoxin family protein [Deinococcus metallilatus]RXJ09774.1 glutaredoxin family protein [Deinococcus metallilatus]TLK24239.1 glutaredoxin family protein [Deinococcus metallilatus]GMA13690.1 NrdH-redoxin [Deinococcus metallilatus]